MPRKVLTSPQVCALYIGQEVNPNSAISLMSLPGAFCKMLDTRNSNVVHHFAICLCFARPRREIFGCF